MSAVVTPSMVHRWTPASRMAAWTSAIVLLGFAVLPGMLGAGAVDRLTALFI